MPDLQPRGPRFPLANLGRIYRNPLREFVGYVGNYGNFVHLPFAGLDVYLLNEPELIQDVLVKQHKSFQKGRALQAAKRLLGEGLLTADGELHRSNRRALQPVFRQDRIAGYAPIMVEHTARMRDRWVPGLRLDAHEEMMRLTLSIIGKALFDIELEQEPQFYRALAESVDNFNRLAVPFAAIVDRLPLKESRRLHHAKQAMDERILRMIRDRRAAGPSGRNDLLSWVLEAQDTEGGHGKLSDRQVRDEAVTIFLAGHETTANALTWTWYLLSQNPAAEAKMHEEVNRVLKGRAPTAADVDGLVYTRRVFAEAMRMYPPAWIIGRRATQDLQLGAAKVRKGSLCIMSQYMMHHDARFYPEPDRFEPDRWTPEAEKQRPRFAYFPFGGGPRLCIGEPFAWMEAVLILATVAQRWRLRLAPDARVEMLPQLTLRPKFGMAMVAEARAA